MLPLCLTASNALEPRCKVGGAEDPTRDPAPHSTLQRVLNPQCFSLPLGQYVRRFDWPHNQSTLTFKRVPRVAVCSLLLRTSGIQG